MQQIALIQEAYHGGPFEQFRGADRPPNDERVLQTIDAGVLKERFVETRDG